MTRISITKRLVFLVLISGLCVIKGFANANLTGDSARAVLKRSFEEHSVLKDRHIGIDTYLFLGSQVISAMQGEVILRSDYSCSDIMGIITISERDKVLLVDVPNRTILNTSIPVSVSSASEPVASIDDFKTLFDKQEESKIRMTRSPDGTFLISIEPAKAILYKKIELTVGSSDYLIRRAVYYYKNPVESGADKLEMKYSYRSSKGELPLKFRRDTYVVEKAGVVTLKPNYSTYRLVMNSED